MALRDEAAYQHGCRDGPDPQPEHERGERGRCDRGAPALARRRARGLGRRRLPERGAPSGTGRLGGRVAGRDASRTAAHTVSPTAPWPSASDSGLRCEPKSSTRFSTSSGASATTRCATAAWPRTTSGWPCCWASPICSSLSRNWPEPGRTAPPAWLRRHHGPHRFLRTAPTLHLTQQLNALTPSHSPSQHQARSMALCSEHS